MTRPWRILVIGCGSIGERHTRCFLNTRAAAVGICEIRDDLRNRVASTYGIDETFDELGAALHRRWDAAVIATPAHTHAALAQRAVEAGVSVLVEKPLALTLDGMDVLRDALCRKQLIAGVAYVYRAHPAVRAMHDAIARGRFGRPLQLVAVGGQHFPSYRPAYRDIYYTRREHGGGAIQDALTHMVNTAEWLVGPVTRLSADAAHLKLEGVDVEDTVHVIARHGPVLASYSLNQHQAPNELTISVICEAGALCFEMHHQRWKWMAEPDQPWHEEPAQIRDRDDLFIRQASAWLDALAGKAPPLCTFEEGLQTLRVNLAVLASAEAGGLPQEVLA